MLARALPGVPVLVGADRYLSRPRWPSAGSARPSTCSTMGFSISSWRATSICCSSPRTTCSDQPLPAGRLRERLGAAAAADAALVTAGYDTAAERIGRALRHRAGVSRDARDRRAAPSRRRARFGRRAVGARGCSSVTGIARPERFCRRHRCRRLGDLPARSSSAITIRSRARDVGASPRRREAAASAIVLTTEKDAVRLAACDLGDLPIASVPLVVGIEPARRSGGGCSTLAIREPQSPSESTIANHRIRSGNPQSAIRDHHEASHRVSARAVLIASCALMPGPLVARAAALLGLAFYTVDRAHRRIAQRNLAAAFPGADRGASGARSPARAFAHFGRLLFELLKFSTLSPEAMLARVEFDGEERVAARVRAGQGRAVHHRPFRLLGAAGDGARAASRSRSACSRARSTTRSSTGCSNASAQRTGNTVIYRRGTIRRVMRTLQAGQGVAVLIDQHIMSRDAIYVDFFDRPAATTSAVAALALRTGAPVVPVFALPLGGGRYRMIYEHPVEPPRAEAADAGPRVHAAVHRRPRDVRAPPSGAVAVDAPALARQRPVDRQRARAVSRRPRVRRTDRRRSQRVTDIDCRQIRTVHCSVRASGGP